MREGKGKGQGKGQGKEKRKGKGKGREGKTTKEREGAEDMSQKRFVRDSV
jgi:hypothetical protein